MPRKKGHSSGKARAKPYEKHDKKESATDRERTEDNQPNEETKMDVTDSLISRQWRFNKSLDEIAESLTEKDLTRMKFYCTNGLIGRNALTEAESPLMFFQLLMDSEFLSCNNLLHLQAMLWHINRTDLYKKMVKIAKECGRHPLHFLRSKSKPVHGFKHVKFHIKGSETNRREIENLRSVVAELLCVRHEDVALVGFEPSNSVIITFMLPEEAIETLHDLSPEDRSVLNSMKVDYIVVDEQKVPLIGKRMEKPTTKSQITAISKLQADEKYSRTEVERLQSLLLQRTEEQRLAKSNGNGTRQNAKIQVSVKMVTQQVQTGDMATDMSIVQAENAHHNKVTKALEEISKMLKPTQRKSLLRQSGINETDERVSKNSNEQFMLNLYRLQSPKQENNELKFAKDLVHKLDDKTLYEKMYNIVVDLAKISFCTTCNAAVKDITRRPSTTVRI